MARQKSVCLKWTVVLLIFTICPSVYSRPQDTSAISSSTNSVLTDNATENPLRYRYKNNYISLDYKLPIVIGVRSSINTTNIGNTDLSLNENKTRLFSNLKEKVSRSNNRTSRLTRKRVQNVKLNNQNKISSIRKVDNDISKEEQIITLASKRPTIKKVITKWTDKTKYEDLPLSYETSTSTEIGDDMTFASSSNIDDDDFQSTVNIVDQVTISPKRHQSQSSKRVHVMKKSNTKKHYRPNPNYSEESTIHSNKVHVLQYPIQNMRPTYIFTTPMPTPIITNVGNPKPWHHNVQTANRRPTQKPIRVTKPSKNQYNNYHNSVNNYPQYIHDNFEVTTFQPSPAYTERIVIRPEEYSASSDDCPTIYLTLNNTFQGQGKEACPDLNIAVNTNVINKNVVLESEEEDAESIFPDNFGLPLGDDSAGEESPGDYFGADSEENQEAEQQSASVEEAEFSNYNAANANIESESAEPGAFGSPSSALSHKPGRPGSLDDDIFSFSSVVDFFKPAINAMSWLAAISPFSFGILSFVLTPIALLLAGYSGVAALFAPLGLAREAPEEIYIHRPKWEWDHEYKTWHLNSFPDNRRWVSTERLSRNSKEENIITNTVKPTLFYKIKEWMKIVTKRLRNENKNLVLNSHKSKRKKRDTWSIH